MKKLHVRTLSIALAAVLLLALLPVGALAAGDSPSGWAAADIADITARGFIPEALLSSWGTPITREEFCAAIMGMYDKVTENATAPNTAANLPFADISSSVYKAAVIKAVDLGIIQGADGGKFLPENNLSRQECAVIILRMLNGIFPDADRSAPAKAYTDRASIASWAAAAVDFLSKDGIMQGVGAGFDPLGLLTREQALAIILRAYKHYSLSAPMPAQSCSGGTFAYRDGGNVYYSTGAQLRCQELSTGVTQKVASHGSSFVVSDNYIYAAQDYKAPLMIDKATGKVTELAYDYDGHSCYVTEQGGWVFLTADNGKVHKLRADGTFHTILYTGHSINILEAAGGRLMYKNKWGIFKTAALDGGDVRNVTENAIYDFVVVGGAAIFQQADSTGNPDGELYRLDVYTLKVSTINTKGEYMPIYLRDSAYAVAVLDELCVMSSDYAHIPIKLYGDNSAYDLPYILRNVMYWHNSRSYKQDGLIFVGTSIYAQGQDPHITMYDTATGQYTPIGYSKLEVSEYARNLFVFAEVAGIPYKYTADKGDYADTAKAYKKAAELAAELFKPGMGDADKVRAVNTWLVSNARYDTENYENNSVPMKSHMAYGVLVEGVGVCNSYSEAAYLLLNLGGVECVEVYGDAYGSDGWGGHAWNIVSVNGRYYHLDVTWNDGDFTQGGANVVYTDYLLISDSQISRDHRWDKSLFPSCPSGYRSALTALGVIDKIAA